MRTYHIVAQEITAGTSRLGHRLLRLIALAVNGRRQSRSIRKSNERAITNGDVQTRSVVHGGTDGARSGANCLRIT